ncbi:MAG: hypothetical protein HC853_14725 [Anaerolineae bacterium]|nr:hypothetical protein [Anaerolineae bacterium]
MLKQLGRSYVAHAVVGAGMSLLLTAVVFAITFSSTGLIGEIVRGLLLVNVILLPTVAGGLMYELRRRMTREPFSLRSLFVYGLTSATSIVMTFLILNLFLALERVLQLHNAFRIGPTSTVIQVLSLMLAGACVGVACLAIDNRR